MDYQDILEKVISVIIHDNRPPLNVHANANLKDKLHYDNLGLVSLLRKVENEFEDCNIPSSKISTLSTVGDIAILVDSIINPES